MKKIQVRIDGEWKEVHGLYVLEENGCVYPISGRFYPDKKIRLVDEPECEHQTARVEDTNCMHCGKCVECNVCEAHKSKEIEKCIHDNCILCMQDRLDYSIKKLGEKLNGEE